MRWWASTVNRSKLIFVCDYRLRSLHQVNWCKFKSEEKNSETVWKVLEQIPHVDKNEAIKFYFDHSDAYWFTWTNIVELP